MFEINSNTELNVSGFSSIPVGKAIRRFYRDISFTTNPTERIKTIVSIERDASLSEESWRIESSDYCLRIYASDELGVIYALNYISYFTLGIKPLWYWCNQTFEKKDSHIFSHDYAESEHNAIRFRGWFINDEVLFLGWEPDGFGSEQWEMAFEALLRLEGNIIIPGTDKDAAKYQGLASSMGLWITQHHAQPLGAEMFSRAYPGVEPSYIKYPDLFERLWREAVIECKDLKILWTIGFRGQGDIPFWGNDEAFDTDEKRAQLINRIIRKQIDIVREYVNNPVFAFNIYSETAIFYKEDLLDIPDGVIKLFADNGYGAMVSRREWDVDPRVPSLPKPIDKNTPNGMYYHVSFYDLQAANHITMIPVSFSVLSSELNKAYESGIREALILNVSNIKPHLVPISLVADFWKSGKADGNDSLKSFSSAYYGGWDDRIIELYDSYSKAAIKYGKAEDNRAGDQYFVYPLRIFLTAWMKQSYSGTHNYDFVFHGNLDSQINHYREEMAGCLDKYRVLAEDIKAYGNKLLDENLGVHVRWYIECAMGAIAFSDAYDAFRKEDYVSAFISAGKAVDYYLKAIEALRSWEHDKWIGFYSNEALTDTGNAVNMLKALMEYIRVWGEGPDFYKWHRLFTYTPEDRDVVLVTNYENRMSAYDMYLRYKKMRSIDDQAE